MKKKEIKTSSTIRKIKPRKNFRYFSSWQKISLVVVLFCITLFTVIVAQNPQTLLQHAAVSEPGIVGQFHCISLGPSNCKGVVSIQGTPCPGLTVVTGLKLTPTYLEQGEKIQAAVTYKNPCTNDTFKIEIVAIDPKGNSHTFAPTGEVQPGQQVSLPATLAIAPDAPPGQWTAQAEYISSTGKPQPASKTPLTFTVCGPLRVSKAISVAPTTVYQGKTVTGQITYTNTCNAPFAIKDAMIEAHDPNKTLKDFTPHTGVKTLAPKNGTLTIKASRTMSTDAKVDPLGPWGAFGSYQNNAGKWVPDKTLAKFTLAVPPPPVKNAPKTGNGSGATSKACVAPLTTALTVQFPTYNGGTVSVPKGSDTALNAYAAALKKDKTIAVSVNGYTDASGFAQGTTGSIANNQQLSQARAQTVADYLKKPGGATNTITVKGNGVASGATTNDQAARIAVVTSCGAKSSVTGGGTTGSPASSGSQQTSGPPASGSQQTGGPAACSQNCGQSMSCSLIGGTCENASTSTKKANFSFIQGLCPGGSQWECYAPNGQIFPGSPATFTCSDGMNVTQTGCTCPSKGYVSGGFCNICPPGEFPGAGNTCVSPSTEVHCSGNTYNYHNKCITSCPAAAPIMYKDTTYNTGNWCMTQ